MSTRKPEGHSNYSILTLCAYTTQCFTITILNNPGYVVTDLMHNPAYHKKSQLVTTVGCSLQTEKQKVAKSRIEPEF